MLALPHVFEGNLPSVTQASAWMQWPIDMGVFAKQDAFSSLW